MSIEDSGPEALWRYYQRGYHHLIQSGYFFRQILRPALSHVYFQRAIPLLVEYAQANRGEGDLPPGFGDRMEASHLTARDLLHLDYAICLGYAETQGYGSNRQTALIVLDWPGLGANNGAFIAADALLKPETEYDEEFPTTEEQSSEEDDGSKPPFDL